jgi:histidine triad (HIT) family protein
MAYDSNNIFARMARGEIPCIKVYEDADTLAFMDIMPQADGHTLVIPKLAGENLLDSSPEAICAALRTTQRVARAVQRAMQAPGIVITQFNGAAAGQTVFHLHFHVLPAFPDRGYKLHARQKADPAVLEAQAVRIRAALAEG